MLKRNITPESIMNSGPALSPVVNPIVNEIPGRESALIAALVQQQIIINAIKRQIGGVAAISPLFPQVGGGPLLVL